jgi:hypothetical protein
MTTTSDRPITVDGVRLDTLAWNIEKINRAGASRREADVAVPGRDGALPSLNDDLDSARLGLEMFVMGTDEDGAVPVAGRRDTLRENLDELVHLFGKRHALLEVQEVVAAGVTRRAWAKVTDSIAPDLNTPGSSGQFAVSMVLPYGVWEDVGTTDWTQVAPGAAVEVTSLQGATERVLDAILLVKGPITNPRITDPATGAYVELQAALTAADYWRVNVGTWATRTGNLGLGSSDATGTDRQAVTRFGGTPNQAAFLPLTPVRDTGARRVRLTLTGSGTDGTTALSVRARRKYAL